MNNFIKFFYNMKVTNTNFINNYYEFNHNNNYYRLYILNEEYNIYNYNNIYTINKELINNTLMSEIILNKDKNIINKYIWSSKKIAVPFPTDAEKFCEVYKNMREMEKPYHSEKVLRIHFEDLIYKYDDTVKKIEKFIGFKPEDHINKKTRFIPEMSIKNTQTYSSEVYKDEIKIIENKLKSYLYKFPYKIDNKVEETVEFD